MKNYTITVNGTVYDVTVEEAAQEAHLSARQRQKQLRRHPQQLRHRHRQHPQGMQAPLK